MFYPHLPFAEYRKLPGNSISNLKELDKSPLKYKHRLANPFESAAMNLGSATHTAVLEPDLMAREYMIFDGTRRGKEWEAFQTVAQAAGKKILKADEYALALAMRDAVRGYEPAMKYLRRGEAEVSMTWTDADLGIPCRGRIDWLADLDGEPVLVGLKTARDGRHFKFGAAAFSLGYHLQWAYYLDGFHALTGKSPKVVEIVVENTAPHEPAVYVIPDEILDLGRDEYRRLLVKLQECESLNSWPPSLDDEEPLSFPTYAYRGLGDDSDLSDLDLTA